MLGALIILGLGVLLLFLVRNWLITIAAMLLLLFGSILAIPVLAEAPWLVKRLILFSVIAGIGFVIFKMIQTARRTNAVDREIAAKQRARRAIS